MFALDQETAQKYEVFQMPTFLFMRSGEVIEQFSGANAAVLRQKIESLVGTNVMVWMHQEQTRSKGEIYVRLLKNSLKKSRTPTRRGSR